MPTIRTDHAYGDAAGVARSDSEASTRAATDFSVPLAQVAAALDASYPAVHKTPDASSLQRRLAP
jgi:hypothetical protein